MDLLFYSEVISMRSRLPSLSPLREGIVGKEGLFIHSFDHHLLPFVICDQDSLVNGFDADIDFRWNHDLITLVWIEIMNEIAAFS